MFFGEHEREIARRRDALVARSAGLRRDLVADAEVLRTPLWLADKVWTAWRWLKANPDAVAAGVVVVAIVQPRRAWRFARLAWRGWRTWRWLDNLVAEAQAGFARARGRPVRSPAFTSR